ncbi:TcaA NTF2-like domain-containing protein [Staphylococcus americanisciuri]|uniref:Membrane-associated protein TcaA n=1 Tax=Staphylococcus americanisciuri TaxID=2973940 RepID=A0ABT2F0W8_9STAP|nr:teicoplanin resistance protein VanZ [Staphylococcus americanisciuri]MCS4486094.1 teicoplanin resistance protein VanZ [Staphylococcus americanisciuri]
MSSQKNTDLQDETSAASMNVLKKWVPVIIVSFIIVLLLILFLLLRNFNSPEAQAKIFVNAVQNDDASKVATLISTKQNKVGRKDAERYIQFIKNEMGFKVLKKEVYTHVEKLNEDSPVAYEIKTADNQTILRISKNGRRYFIFDNLGFQAPTKNAVLKLDTDATYEFSSDGNKKKIVGSKGEMMTLGQFIPGDYTIDATKTTSRGTYEGQLKFNTGSTEHDSVKVTEAFKEARVKVDLKNSSQLSQDSVKVIINGEKFDVADSKIYGPFPLNKDLTISAEGTLQGKTFQAEEKKISQSDVTETNEVTVSFNQQAIEKYQEEQKQNLTKKISEFVKKYTSALNEAYQSHNMSAIESYLLKDTEFYKTMITDVKKQEATQYQTSQVTNVDRTNDFYSVLVQTETEDGQTIQAHYLLQGDEAAKNLKIVNYQSY